MSALLSTGDMRIGPNLTKDHNQAELQAATHRLPDRAPKQGFHALTRWYLPIRFSSKYTLTQPWHSLQEKSGVHDLSPGHQHMSPSVNELFFRYLTFVGHFAFIQISKNEWLGTGSISMKVLIIHNCNE